MEKLREWLGLREIYILDKGIFWNYILCLFIAFNFLIMGINKLFFWNLKPEEVPYTDALIVIVCLFILSIFIILLLKFSLKKEFKEKYGTLTSVFVLFLIYSSMLLAFLIAMLIILKITQGKPLYIFKNYAVGVAVLAGVSPYVIRFANWKNQNQENY